MSLEEGDYATHELFVVKIEKRLLNAPHCHLVGLVKGQQDCCEERPVHLEIDMQAWIA